MTYEEAFQQLEAVLGKLEQGDLPLYESLKQYEEGVRALRACREILGAAERRIEELTPGPDGPQLRPAGGEASA